jgi:hypothetical protein
LEEAMVVNVFFGKDTIQVSESQLRYTVESLISDIGGTIGVYAGMSIITIYQALLYLGHGIMKMIKQRSAHHIRKISTYSSNIVDGTAATAMDCLTVAKKHFHTVVVLDESPVHQLSEFPLPDVLGREAKPSCSETETI